MPLTRRVRRILIGGGIIALVSSVTACAFAVSTWRFGNTQAVHLPAPLTADLRRARDGGDEAGITEEFDERVRSRFPIGSDEWMMIWDLKREGFTLWDRAASPDLEREASKWDDNWMCQRSAHIYWQVGADGRLTAIKGVYRQGACL